MKETNKNMNRSSDKYTSERTSGEKSYKKAKNQKSESAQNSGNKR